MKVSQCKICRRIGEKLFLKGERCFTPKCAMIKKPYKPGVHKKTRVLLSEYGRQLNEKQKIRKTYGLLEKQFKNYVKAAIKEKGDSRENLMKKLEKRLDNTVFRLGWAKSRNLARQIVSHGHILVNNRKVNIPSYQVKIGDVIALKEKSKKSSLFENLKISLKKYQTPSWLSLNKEKLEGKVVSQPTIEDLGDLSGIGMIIEYYSR